MLAFGVENVSSIITYKNKADIYKFVLVSNLMYLVAREEQNLNLNVNEEC
jgi:hypothetical protein